MARVWWEEVGIPSDTFADMISSVFFWAVIRKLFRVGILAWDLNKQHLGWIFCYYRDYIIKKCNMPFCIPEALNESLEGLILSSGFQCVPLSILLLGRINSGVLLGGSFVRVSVIVLKR